MPRRVLVIIRIDGHEDLVLRQEELSTDTKIFLMRDVKVLVDELERGVAKLDQILEENK